MMVLRDTLVYDWELVHWPALSSGVFRSLPSHVALKWLKERFIIVMFYAWRLVKRKLILNTNKFCVDSEKTSVKV